MQPEVKKEIKRIKRLGWQKDKGLGQVAGLFTDLGNRQDAYSFIIQCNKMTDKDYAVAPVAFVQDVVRPCIVPNFGVFMTQYLGLFEHTLVFTDPMKLPTVELAHRAKKVFYPFLIPKEGRERAAFDYILDNDEYAVVARSEKYKEMMGGQYPVAEDFNIKEILNVTTESV